MNYALQLTIPSMQIGTVSLLLVSAPVETAPHAMARSLQLAYLKAQKRPFPFGSDSEKQHRVASLGHHLGRNLSSAKNGRPKFRNFNLSETSPRNPESVHM